MWDLAGFSAASRAPLRNAELSYGQALLTHVIYTGLTALARARVVARDNSRNSNRPVFA
jgi:hypothetical protein